MTLISIRERGTLSATPVVAIDGQEYPLANGVTPPFDEQAEAQLEWYFEEHLRFPFTHQVRAQEAAASIRRYGEALFEQIFGDRRLYGRYQTALQSGVAKNQPRQPTHERRHADGAGHGLFGDGECRRTVDGAALPTAFPRR